MIGDRLATDMILSSRLSSLSLPLTVPAPVLPSDRTASSGSSVSASPTGSLSQLVARLRPTPKLTVGRAGQRIEAIPVLTTKLWGREGAGTTLMRFGEKAAVRGLEWRTERARRTRRRAVTGALARPEEEEVEWRRYTFGWEAEQQRAATEAPPKPPALATTRDLPAAPVTRRASVRSLGEALSTISARISTATSSLLTLPYRIPNLASSFLHSLPQRVHDLTTRVFLAFLRMLERRGPGAVRVLEGGLQRLVDIYRPPNEGVTSTALVSKRSRDGNDDLPRFEVVERAVDRLEQRWDEAGRTLDRLRGRVGEVTGRAAEQAEAVRRRLAPPKAETGPSGRL